MPPQSAAARHYSWPRFWTNPGENIDDGFFPDTSSIFAGVTEASQLRDLLEEPCLILLGEPG
ncbi:MAG: hypothetical protein M3065_19015, partial [Actinomycetota bacterium]|nr:hypothetical protein [Actinomycetota bacterium]